ncbi:MULTISPECIES: Rab family GTPase [unclassified Legionella]|uniref:Rab family GTPase n=1 Tax=unclassified Legionella TaxID=2622702 RepID=UPI001054849D|nr:MULTISPECIES: Rab family GTPase [unclassified Legionella]MDI9818114.1 Rab family GTPase [Legionella sp. PL877]
MQQSTPGQIGFFKSEDIKSSKIIAVDGDKDAGKTALIMRYAQDLFTDHKVDLPLPTIEKTIEEDGRAINLKIIDTNSGSRFAVENQRIPRCNAIILAFDLTNKEDFENLPQWLKEKRRYYGERVEIILAGTKMDGKMAVSEEEVATFAKDNGLTYVLTSAKNNQNINQLFTGIIETLTKPSNAQVTPIILPKEEEGCRCNVM